MEQKLPADWQQLVDEYHGYGRGIVERCFALHSKPKKELTDAEIIAIGCRDGDDECAADLKFARDVIAAHEAKQREPETVTFRAARRRSDSQVDLLDASISLPDHWEWLDHDGKPQTFEVVLP